jgi:RNA polymerase sigma factor (sigma-70 family)
MDEQHDTLLKALQEGERFAYEELYRVYNDRLFNKALGVLRNHVVAKEVVQECLGAVYEKKLYSTVNRSLGALLMVSTIRKCYYHLRKEQRRDEQRHHYLLEVSDSHWDNSTEDYLEQKEQLFVNSLMTQRLTLAFDSLSPRQRIFIRLIYFEEKSYQEAAAIHGVSRNTIKTQLRRGLQKMRTHLDNELPTSP